MCVEDVSVLARDDESRDELHADEPIRAVVADVRGGLTVLPRHPPASCAPSPRGGTRLSNTRDGRGSYGRSPNASGNPTSTAMTASKTATAVRAPLPREGRRRSPATCGRGVSRAVSGTASRPRRPASDRPRHLISSKSRGSTRRRRRIDEQRVGDDEGVILREHLVGVCRDQPKPERIQKIADRQQRASGRAPSLEDVVELRVHERDAVPGEHRARPLEHLKVEALRIQSSGCRSTQSQLRRRSPPTVLICTGRLAPVSPKRTAYGAFLMMLLSSENLYACSSPSRRASPKANPKVSTPSPST